MLSLLYVAAQAIALTAAPAPARAHGEWGVAYAPLDTSTPRPAIVFLHGMWASPEDSCGAFERAAAPAGFLACPRGNAPLGDSGDLKMWVGTYVDAGRSIRAALDAASALAPGKLDRTHGGTLIGFSNGAYFAAEVACAERGRWTGLVLLSMKLDLDPQRLRAAGVQRVVLGAGDLDDVRDSMKALAAHLARPSDGGAGVDTRFMSLGAVGHAFPPDMGERMYEAVAWASGASAIGDK